MSVKPDKKTPAAKKKLDEKVDQQSDESFPASDPPSYSGGKHIIGAPKKRETPAPECVKPDVKAKK